MPINSSCGALWTYFALRSVGSTICMFFKLFVSVLIFLLAIYFFFINPFVRWPVQGLTTIIPTCNSYLNSSSARYNTTYNYKNLTLDQRELAVISPLSRSMDLKFDAAAARTACSFSWASFFKGRTLQVLQNNSLTNIIFYVKKI